MKKMYLMAAVMMVLGSLAGLAGCSREDKKDGEAIEITVMNPFNENDGNRENFVNAYQAYEEVTGNVVNDVASITNEEWKAQVTADFKDGNEPDVLFYFTGADADELVKSKKVVLVSEIRKEFPEYASNMKDSMMPVSTFDGRQYAIPVNGYWESLFVNKKVLKACGVSVPGSDYTWEQFLKDCQTIKVQGYTPIACSLMEVPHYWFEYCTFNNGSISNHTSLPESAGSEQGKAWVSGLNDIKYLYEQGFYPENTTTATDDETAALMLKNQAAFMLDGSWKVGWFLENAENIDDFVVTYVPAKGKREATEIIGGLSMGYYITSKAWNDPEKRQACVEFVHAMTSDEVVSTFGELSITALKKGTKPVENADSLTFSALDMNKGCTGIASAAQDLLTVPARTALFNDVNKIVAGEIMPQEAVENALMINQN